MSKTNKILWHIFAIALFIFIESYVVILMGSKAFLGDFIIFYGVQIVFFFLATHLILPKIDLLIKLWSIKVLLLAIYVVTFAYLIFGITLGQYRFRNVAFDYSQYKTYILRYLMRQIYIFSIAFGYWYAKKSILYERQKREQDVAISKQNEEYAKLELALLRTQMSPHLMVNALSSVQGILMERAPETVRIIYSLMDIQTSALEMSNPAFRNSLSNELKVMQQVIDLFKNLGKTNFQLSLEIDEESKQMDFPPHALVTLIENVFKHADFNKKDMPPFILIKADISKVQILIQNKTAINLPNSEREQMGTKSVLQTLENFYPKRYRWKESFAAGFYELDLKILRNDPA